jgi:general secretion pathway protein K
MDHRRQHGVALVLVLWVLMLITVSTGSFALMARMDGLEAHTVLWTTKARMGAEAGVNLAVLTLRASDGEGGWVADGRPNTIYFEDMTLEIEVTDERGKVDLNTADAATLMQMFIGHGLDDQAAEYLAAAIEDWRDEDDIERTNGAEESTYSAYGLDLGPGNRAFVMTEEVLQVLGMSWELFLLIEPGVTVFSQGKQPDPAFAPAEALMALPDMNAEDARNFVAERHSQDPDNPQPLSLPNGQVAMARGRGLTYSIHAKATLPNGVWDQVEATIRLGGNSDGQPYRVLRWREGFHH